MLETFAKVGRLDTPTVPQAQQARLSLRRGGAGFRSLREHREAVGVGSWLAIARRDTRRHAYHTEACGAEIVLSEQAIAPQIMLGQV